MYECVHSLMFPNISYIANTFLMTVHGYRNPYAHALHYRLPIHRKACMCRWVKASKHQDILFGAAIPRMQVFAVCADPQDAGRAPMLRIILLHRPYQCKRASRIFYSANNANMRMSFCLLADSLCAHVTWYAAVYTRDTRANRHAKTRQSRSHATWRTQTYHDPMRQEVLVVLGVPSSFPHAFLGILRGRRSEVERFKEAEFEEANDDTPVVEDKARGDAVCDRVPDCMHVCM